MTNWVWIDLKVTIALHDEQISEHGGQSGIRDAGLLESALSRPVNRSHYEAPSIAELASAYGFGIAKNHPFLDGNKRTAMVATELFLALNNYTLVADDESCLMAFLALADGSLSEEEFTAWICNNILPAE